MTSKLHRKHDFPVHRTREHLEPGPIVMISSAYKGERNIMTWGWHMMLEYIAKRGLFIWAVVKAHVASLRNPKTLHYRGQGVFRLAAGSVSRRRLFKPDRLE
jgi:hypothetical protein